MKHSEKKTADWLDLYLVHSLGKQKVVQFLYSWMSHIDHKSLDNSQQPQDAFYNDTVFERVQPKHKSFFQANLQLQTCHLNLYISF